MSDLRDGYIDILMATPESVLWLITIALAGPMYYVALKRVGEYLAIPVALMWWAWGRRKSHRGRGVWTTGACMKGRCQNCLGAMCRHPCHADSALPRVES